MMNSKLHIKLGKKIKSLRLDHQWTQEQISAKLSISRNAYSDIELGKSDIYLSRLANIAQLFNLDLFELLVFDEETVFNVDIHHTITQTNIITSSRDIISKTKNMFSIMGSCATECPRLKAELEKQHLLIQTKDQEIDYLKKIIALQKIIKD